MTPPIRIKIDFVSDVSCPWCAVGLGALEQAVARLGDAVQVEMHFQPFELNPHMAPEGQDISEHIAEKYGSTPEQMAQSRETIRQRGAEVGFDFRMADTRRIYNTFDAHRLLHWAEAEGQGLQPALKKRLLKAYFTDGQNPSDRAVLVRLAEEVGLDPARAAAILAGNTYAAEVRELQRYYQQHGIQSVPAVVVNDRHLISGGQPADVFEQALRQIAATTAQEQGAT